MMMSDDEFLRRLEELLRLHGGLPSSKSHYTVEEFARLVKKAPFTIRSWCWKKRIHATKSNSMSGPYAQWVISHEEFLRYKREGLLSVRLQPRWGTPSNGICSDGEDRPDVGGETGGPTPCPKRPRISPRAPATRKTAGG